MSNLQVPVTTEEAAFALARDNFAAYMRLMFPLFERAPHLDALIQVLHEVDTGATDRLIVLMPPRHGKTMCTSQFFPSWYLGRHPTEYVIVASYAQGLADDIGRRVRNNVADPMHTRIFPECTLAADSAAADRFFTTMGGAMFAVGRGGPITGRGAHCLIVDDPIKDRAEAHSETIRKQLHEWFTSVAYTRLMPGGKVIVIQTLWHEDDLAGWLQREHMDDGWKVIRFPAIAETDEGWRKEGEALWPKRFPLRQLNRVRKAIGESDFMSLYQQRCVSEGGMMFKTTWLQDSYLKQPSDGKGMTKYILVDPATSKKKNSDFTAAWVIGLSSDSNIYILDAVRDKLSLTERGDMVFRLHRKWKPISRVVYEEYAMTSDIEYLKERMEIENYRFHIRKVGGHLRKEDRVQALVPYFQSGRIRMPRHLMGLCEGQEVDLIRLFEAEYRSFPVAPHDDMIDALSRLLSPEVQLDWPQTEEELGLQAEAIRWGMGKGPSWMSA